MATYTRPNIDFKRDLFYFRPIQPGQSSVGIDAETDSKRITFEAHIDNISDTSSPSWNETFDMGRADGKQFYSSFSRNVTISFHVISLDEKEHRDNKDSLSKLGLVTYPIYKSSLGYNGYHVLFRVGNLLAGYGIITNLDYSWNNEIPWINSEPIYTAVNISIKLLADRYGKRPKHTSKYF